MADETITQSTGEDDQVNRSHTKALLRFFSVESDINMAANIAESSISTYNFYNKDFLLKIAELLNCTICAALYGFELKIIPDSVKSVCFPNVVFGSYIIITAVIIISYMLGQVMPEVLIRIFLSIGLILFFITATVTITIWGSMRVSQHPKSKNLLLFQALLSYLSSLLYGLDLYFNIRKAVDFGFDGNIC